MKDAPRALNLSAFILTASLLSSACASYTAGYRWEPFARDNGGGPIRSFRIWYPTDFPEKSYAYDALVQGSVGVDAPIAENAKRNPIVLASHDLFSTGVSFARVAERLARLGVVTAAIDHAEREEDVRADPGQAVRNRLVDLFKLYDFLKEKGERWQVDLARMGLLGMGRGSLTVMLAMGVKVEPDPLLITDPVERAFARSMVGFSWPEKRLFPAQSGVAMIAPVGIDMAWPLGLPIPVLLVMGHTRSDLPFTARFGEAGWKVKIESVPRDQQDKLAQSVASFFAAQL